MNSVLARRGDKTWPGTEWDILCSHQKMLALLNELLAKRKDGTKDQRCEKQYNEEEGLIPLNAQRVCGQKYQTKETSARPSNSNSVKAFREWEKSK